jgi:hypothetical protein
MRIESYCREQEECVRCNAERDSWMAGSGGRVLTRGDRDAMCDGLCAHGGREVGMQGWAVQLEQLMGTRGGLSLSLGVGWVLG